MLTFPVSTLSGVESRTDCEAEVFWSVFTWGYKSHLPASRLPDAPHAPASHWAGRFSLTDSVGPSLYGAGTSGSPCKRKDV